jgi:hypothetical protein
VCQLRPWKEYEKPVELEEDETEGSKGFFFFPTSAITVDFLEEEGKRKEVKSSLKAFGKTATLQGTTEVTLQGGGRWGVCAIACKTSSVWFVNKKKLFEEVNTSRELAQAAKASEIKLESSEKPEIAITCTEATPKAGSIKNRRELDTEIKFQKCTVTKPATCLIREGATEKTLTFKQLEGKLAGDVVTFVQKEEKVPVAEFEVFNKGVEECKSKGTYVVTGLKTQVFVGRLRNPENEELERPFVLNAINARLESTIKVENKTNNERRSGTLAGEVAFKLNPAKNWSTGPEK